MSFFFIERNSKNIVVEYWEKNDVNKPYSKSRNDYMCKNTVFTVEQASEAEDFSQIPKRLKLTFPSELFDSVHQLMPVVNQVWDIIVDGVGLSAFYRRRTCADYSRRRGEYATGGAGKRIHAAEIHGTGHRSVGKIAQALRRLRF